MIGAQSDSIGTDAGGLESGAGIDVSMLGLLLGGVFLRCLVTIAFFGGVHHVYII